MVTSCDNNPCESPHTDLEPVRVESVAHTRKTLMEFLLLWADNFDDAIHALRHLAPKILALLLAFSLFALTGIALIHSPNGALAALGLVLSAGLVEAVRRRKHQQVSERG